MVAKPVGFVVSTARFRHLTFTTQHYTQIGVRWVVLIFRVEHDYCSGNETVPESGGFWGSLSWSASQRAEAGQHGEWACGVSGGLDLAASAQYHTPLILMRHLVWDNVGASGGVLEILVNVVSINWLRYLVIVEFSLFHRDFVGLSIINPFQLETTWPTGQWGFKARQFYLYSPFLLETVCLKLLYMAS